jgi:hypothetical protein
MGHVSVNTHLFGRTKEFVDVRYLPFDLRIRSHRISNIRFDRLASPVLAVRDCFRKLSAGLEIFSEIGTKYAGRRG